MGTKADWLNQENIASKKGNTSGETWPVVAVLAEGPLTDRTGFRIQVVKSPREIDAAGGDASKVAPMLSFTSYNLSGGQGFNGKNVRPINKAMDVLADALGAYLEGHGLDGATATINKMVTDARSARAAKKQGPKK